jgi:hypothetical protein
MWGRWFVCAALAVFGGWIAAATSSGAGTYGHQHLATACQLTETATGDYVAAVTQWQMWNSRHVGNQLEGYRWQARLIPAKPGFNFHRPWEDVSLDEVEAAAPGNYQATVTTPAVSALLDWDLQVKLTWDRSGYRDWNVEHVLDSDESRCFV